MGDKKRRFLLNPNRVLYTDFNLEQARREAAAIGRGMHESGAYTKDYNQTKEVKK